MFVNNISENTLFSVSFSRRVKVNKCQSLNLTQFSLKRTQEQLHIAKRSQQQSRNP